MVNRKKSKGKSGRPIVRHGAYSYLTNLTIPDHRAYLRPYLTAVREGLIHDLGPTEEDLTTAQKLIIDRIISQAGVIRLIEEYCREQGIFRGSILQPVLAKNYGAFTNSLRLNLQALGMERREPAALDVLEYVARAYPEDKAPEAPEVADKGPRIAQDGRSPEDASGTTDNSDNTPGGEIDDKAGKGDEPGR
jgi:hypothetical protein